MGKKAISSPNPGHQWERTAESFLRNRGLKLLQRNFSSRFGEIDLIMEDGKTVVFVEVRYRKYMQHGSGAESSLIISNTEFHLQHCGIWQETRTRRPAAVDLM